jgi:hypothetical protein
MITDLPLGPQTERAPTMPARPRDGPDGSGRYCRQNVVLDENVKLRTFNAGR